MPAPLAISLRQRLVDAYSNGEGSFAEMARRFKVAINSAKNWVAQQRTTGNLDPKPIPGGSNAKIKPEHFEKIRESVQRQNDLTQEERAAQWEDLLGVAVTKSTVGRVMRMLDLTRKKSRSSTSAARTPTSGGSKRSFVGSSRESSPST